MSVNPVPSGCSRRRRQSPSMRTRARCRMTRHWTTLLLRSCGNRGGRLFAKSCRTSGCFASLAGIEWAARSTAVYRTGILQNSAAILTAGGCRSTACMSPNDPIKLLQAGGGRRPAGRAGTVWQQRRHAAAEAEDAERTRKLRQGDQTIAMLC